MTSPKITLRVLSLGAGVQSTVLALRAARGEFGPMPDCAIFADTQWEPAAVYAHLDWLEKELPFPVYRVTAGSVREAALAKTRKTGARFASVPFYVTSKNARGGMGRRQCTREFKIDPIRRKLRELLGVKKRGVVPRHVRVEKWLGISSDEAIRMKDSTDRWCVHRFPLIDERINRAACRAWFSRHYPGRDLPKSACIGCPYHTDAMWREMRDSDPKSFRDAVKVDRAIRKPGRGMRGRQFMHSSLRPLAEAIEASQPKGQMRFGFMDANKGFAQECDGMCGV